MVVLTHSIVGNQDLANNPRVSLPLPPPGHIETAWVSLNASMVVTESPPPPAMVTQPMPQAAGSFSPKCPLSSNYSISKTRTGLENMLLVASERLCRNKAHVLGPASRPIQPSSIPFPTDIKRFGIGLGAALSNLTFVLGKVCGKRVSIDSPVNPKVRMTAL